LLIIGDGVFDFSVSRRMKRMGIGKGQNSNSKMQDARSTKYEAGVCGACAYGIDYIADGYAAFALIFFRSWGYA